jgi:hypothetical protein
MSEPVFQSVHHQILVALCQAVRDLELPRLPDDEVQVREDFWVGDEIFEGISLHPLGETYDDGVIGYEDTGYQCGLTVVVARTMDGLLSVENLKLWIEKCRRLFQNQRIPIAEDDLMFADVKKHSLRVRHQIPRVPKQFVNSHRAEQLIVTAWTRELPDDGTD